MLDKARFHLENSLQLNVSPLIYILIGVQKFSNMLWSIPQIKLRIQPEKISQVIGVRPLTMYALWGVRRIESVRLRTRGGCQGEYCAAYVLIGHPF